MKTSDYAFDLPKDLIALYPLQPRSSSNLLVYNNEKLVDTTCRQLPEFLEENDMLVFNDTKVIRAHLTGVRKRISNSGHNEAKISVMLNKAVSGSDWLTLCKPSKRLSCGDEIIFSSNLNARVIERDGLNTRLSFSLEKEMFDKEVLRIGKMPLPPYIVKNRPVEEADALDVEDAKVTKDVEKADALDVEDVKVAKAKDVKVAKAKDVEDADVN